MPSLVVFLRLRALHAILPLSCRSSFPCSGASISFLITESRCKPSAPFTNPSSSKIRALTCRVGTSFFAQRRRTPYHSQRRSRVPSRAISASAPKSSCAHPRNSERRSPRIRSRSGRGLNPAKLLVTFLADEPGAQAQAKLLHLKPNPEELHLIGRELYIYFPNGTGRSKLQWASLAEKLGTSGTARNWNSVIGMLGIAEEMEGSD